MPVSRPSNVKSPLGAHVFRSFTCKYRNSPPNFIECLPITFDKLSENCQVLSGCPVVNVGTPMEKLLK